MEEVKKMNASNKICSSIRGAWYQSTTVKTLEASSYEKSLAALLFMIKWRISLAIFVIFALINVSFFFYCIFTFLKTFPEGTFYDFFGRQIAVKRIKREQKKGSPSDSCSISKLPVCSQETGLVPVHQILLHYSLQAVLSIEIATDNDSL